MPRCTARVALLAALLTGCGSSEEMSPYVVLRVEDPNNIAAADAGGTTALKLTDASGNSNRFDELPADFPLTVTLTSERRGPQRVTVELFRDDEVVGRGSVTVDVLEQNKQEAAVALELICVFSAEGCTPAEQRPGEEAPPSPPGNTPQPEPEPEPEPTQTNTCVKNKTNGVELEPDNTACDTNAGPGKCYAGECVPADQSPSCDEGIGLGFFADGQILGGTGHGVTVNHLQFPQEDADGYNPQWVVQDDDIRPGDPDGPAATSYTIYALSPLRLASFAVRTQDGVRCRFTTEPATAATTVSSTSFTTITLPLPASGTGAQKVRFTFTCDAGGLAGLRLDDFCLVELP